MFLQFFPEFEKECQEVAHSRGLTIPWGFSARELFQKMATTLEPIPEMIAAVKILRTAGMGRAVARALRPGTLNQCRKRKTSLNTNFHLCMYCKSMKNRNVHLPL